MNDLTMTLDKELQAFTAEMKAQKVWDDVTIVTVSEFARTLQGNTGAGSDHGWGGNYFVAGGEVRGKQILGTFPDDLSEDGSQIFEPGIVIPTLPWDAIWNPIAQWFGIIDDNVSYETWPCFILFYRMIFFRILTKNDTLSIYTFRMFRIWMKCFQLGATF